MSTAESTAIDLTTWLPSGAQGQAAAQRDLSDMARDIVGSQILKIANQIRALIAQGHEVCNLTIGDFNPKQFPVPAILIDASIEALNAGITNYPPSDGVVDLRGAITRLYERELGIKYPIESVLIASGGRPLIYATYRALINPGDMVVYPVPSWMNDNYCGLLGARAVEIKMRREENFLPRADDLRPYIQEARLICLNTPVNPTGTMIEADELTRISEMIVEENRRREHAGKPALYVMYDQMYWMLQFGGSKHITPPQVVPEMAAYTIFVDGISKSLAATGLRVGWGVAPPHLTGAMKDILSFVGAWAPHPLQVATAKVLDNVEGLREYHASMLGGVEARLDALYHGFAAMADAGLPVEAVPPQGAIYLSVRFGLQGKTIRGVTFDDNETIRRYLLEQAGCAVVPFEAFGYDENTGWMRFSVGAVSLEQIAAMMPRLQAALTE